MALDPKAIAQERYAKGEISKQEYDQIVRDLSDAPSSPSADLSSMKSDGNSKTPASSRWRDWKNWAAAGAILVFLAHRYAGPSSRGLDFTLESVDSSSGKTVIKLLLVNASDTAGDVTLWRKLGSDLDCERVTRVEANTRYNLVITCSATRAERVEVQAAWSSSVPKRTNLARRM